MKQLKIAQKELIEKGWSGDKKYHVIDADGNSYLLRISSVEQYELKKLEYENTKRIAALNIPMCQPLDFGLCEEGCYLLYRWIHGSDAEPVIPTLSEEKQYAYGLQAGQILQKIHSTPAPQNTEPWSVKFNRKIDRKIKMYLDCPLRYENGGGERLIDYLNKHRHLLNDRPQSFQHGDYHIGNMMIDKDRQLQIIDFNRYDYGDPWEEFNRIVWSAQAAPIFAKGIVDGYFDQAVPMKFWQLLALYIASNTLSSLPWAIPFGPQEIDTMRKQAAQVLSWYDNMNDPVPSWYKL